MERQGTFNGGVMTLVRFWVCALLSSPHHVIIYPRASGLLTHEYIEYVFESWYNLRESITQTAFPSLQGVLQPSARLSYSPDILIIYPPGQALRPLYSHSYSFLELDIRQNIGKNIWRRFLDTCHVGRRVSI